MMAFREVVAATLLVVGSAFMLLAGVGVFRLPDVYLRIHATAKASTMGVGCILLAVAVYFGDLSVVTRAILVAAFVLLTVPVSAHLVARAAHSIGTPLWKGNLVDEEARLEKDRSGGDAFQLGGPTDKGPASEGSTD